MAIFRLVFDSIEYNKVDVVYAEGLNVGEPQREFAIKEAFQAIDQLVEGL